MPTRARRHRRGALYRYEIRCQPSSARESPPASATSPSSGNAEHIGGHRQLAHEGEAALFRRRLHDAQPRRRAEHDAARRHAAAR